MFASKKSLLPGFSRICVVSWILGVGCYGGEKGGVLVGDGGARRSGGEQHGNFNDDDDRRSIESGDVTSVELFYHDMIRQGFSPDTVTYNIRIDSYSKQDGGDLSDVDDFDDLDMIMQQVQSEQQQDEEAERVRHRNYIYRERLDADARLMADYFGPHPKYPEYYFRKRYRMSRTLFLKIVSGIENYIQTHHPLPPHFYFFRVRPGATGLPGFSVIMKCTCAIRQLAYGVTPDSLNEYLQMVTIAHAIV
ncbi:zinc finger, CCHC-type containing protein [Tanacetum coccineum]